MLQLAPTPQLDQSLIVLQGKILERAQLMIELGDADLGDLEQLAARAHEYVVIADSGRLPLIRDTVGKIYNSYQRVEQLVKEHRLERIARAKELQNEIDV